MRPNRLAELLAAPRAVFPTMWPCEDLARAIEISEWHRHQSVLAHTFLVCEALAPLYQGRGMAGWNAPPKVAWLEEHLRGGGDAAARRDLLRLVALLHDVGKPQTLVVGADGQTECPHHAAVSAELSAGMLLELGLGPEARRYVRDVVAGHHLPGTFLDVAAVCVDQAALQACVDRIGASLAFDTLLFYLADFNGCDIEDSLRARKPRLFALVSGLLTDLAQRL
jgi:hypothetical protein